MADYLRRVNVALEYVAYAKNRTHTNPELLKEANEEFRQAVESWSSFMKSNRRED